MTEDSYSTTYRSNGYYRDRASQNDDVTMIRLQSGAAVVRSRAHAANSTQSATAAASVLSPRRLQLRLPRLPHHLSLAAQIGAIIVSVMIHRLA